MEAALGQRLRHQDELIPGDPDQQKEQLGQQPGSSPPGCPPRRRSWRPRRSPHTGLRWCLWTPARQYLEDEMRRAPSELLKIPPAANKNKTTNGRDFLNRLMPQGLASDAKRFCWRVRRHCNFICVCIPKFLAFLRLIMKRKRNK